MNIYVGNLSYQTTEDDLRQAFEAYGQVASSTIIRDKQSGESRGFGFVEMPVQSEGMAAINGLNETELQGRRVRVSEARPQQDRDRRGGPPRDRGDRGRSGGRRGGGGGGRRDY
jgi:RNA recognition motif-containing protein